MARGSHKNKPGGSRYAALAIAALLCIIVGAYLLFAPKSTVAPPAAKVVPAAPQVQTSKKSAPQAPFSPPAAVQKPEITPPPALPPHPDTHPQTPLAAGTGQLAIIIDDMGTTLQEARTLAGIGVPLTFSIIPGLSHYREVAAFAASSGLEIMIHIPMQSKEWPARRLESNGLLVNMADTDIAERTEAFVRSLPKAVGANNHTGSEFTEHEDKMRAVLETLQGRGLFFVDSVTSPKTTGERVAKELGMKTGRRHVFLDNEQDRAYILGQLNQAVRLAKKTGAAIAICHPHPVTIKTLETALPALVAQGITFVPASRLVK